MSIFASAEDTHRALIDAGYLTTFENSQLIWMCAEESWPIILEGPAGGGKTQLALSVAEAEDMPFIRFQCYQGITDKQAIGDYNRALQDMYVQFQARKENLDWEEISSKIRGRDFFMPGPLLQALESEKRAVLLIDEIDKVDYALEAMLLEILSVWELSVPGMGTTKAKKPPFTVVTSNNERQLGMALRRRCAYVQIEYPSPTLEAKIVQRKTPDLPAELHYFIAGFALALRAFPMEKKPSISEMGNLAKALQMLGRREILPEDKLLLLPMIAKTARDQKRLLLESRFEHIVATAIEYRTLLMKPVLTPEEAERLAKAEARAAA